jgi:hypothetical protein
MDLDNRVAMQKIINIFLLVAVLGWMCKSCGCSGFDDDILDDAARRDY